MSRLIVGCGLMVVVLARFVPLASADPTLAFAPPAPFTGTPPLVNDGAVTVQPDFAWDGVADQITINSVPGNVNVVITYPNHPGQDTITIPNWNKILDVTVADFDGDGHPDLLIHGGTPTNEQLAVVLGEGPVPPGTPPPQVAKFSAPLVGFTPCAITGCATHVQARVNDLNGDGKDDFVYYDPNQTVGGVILAISTSTFGSPSFNGPGPDPNCKSGPVLGVATADLNGDGVRDLVMSCPFVQSPGNAQTVAFAGLPGGGYAPGVVALTTACAGTPQIGDINGDGKLDIGDCNGNWAVNTTSPPAATPEAPLAVLLPLSALLVAVPLMWWRHRRILG